MKRPEIEELSAIAVMAAEAGARTALTWQHRACGVREKTGPRDLVSHADVESEAAIRDVLQAHRPADAVLGEETGLTEGETGVRWLVDPIDGTTSYVYGRADWGVSVAATDAEGHIVCGVVIEPAHGRVTHAAQGLGTWADGVRQNVTPRTELSDTLLEINLGRPDQFSSAATMLGALMPVLRDVRRGGSAAVALANLACGRADAVWSPGIQPWDGAAGVIVVTEAGGLVGDLSGPSAGTWPESGDVLAVASEALWQPLQRSLQSIYGDASSARS